MLTASDTAFSVAELRAMEADLPERERLFDDPYARIFAAAGEHAREGTERFASFRHPIRLRTHHIDAAVREGIAGGLRQLVLLGAGFDARALRLPGVARHQVVTFEVDLPAQLDRKRTILESAGITLPASVHHVPCDFLEDFESRLPKDLAAQGFDRDAPTMFVWEGVTPYIGLEGIDRSFRFMASVSAPGSRVVFDFSDLLFDPVPGAERIRRAGFSRFDEVTLADLWRRLLPGEPQPGTEYVKMGLAWK